MLCLKCVKELKDNEQICSNCGYNKDSISNTDNPFGVRNQGIYNPNAVDKEVAEERLEHEKQFNSLVEIFIGPKYYNFKKGSFSWCAFFLGPLYIAFRKMYAVSIIVYIINILITLFFGNKFIIYMLVTLIFQFFLGFSFKKIYYDDSMEKVGKIKQNNPDLGYNQLTEVAKAKGGTNIFYAIIIMLGITILISLSMMIFHINLPESDIIRPLERLLNKLNF